MIVATRLYAWWIQWWWVDFVVAAILVSALHQAAHAGSGSDVLGELKLADRQSAYADALQMTSVFGGFSTLAFTIYLGLNSSTVKRIKVAAGVPLLKVWIAALVTPWLCAVLMVCCVVTDRGDQGSSNVTRWVAIAALVVVLLQMVRIIWIFYQLAVADTQGSGPAKAVSDEEVRIVTSRRLGAQGTH